MLRSFLVGLAVLILPLSAAAFEFDSNAPINSGDERAGVYAQQQVQASPPSESKSTTFAMRLGLTVDYAAATPRFYGLGGVGEVTALFARRIGVGVRLDGLAMLGFGITEEVSAGARVMGGALGKTELLVRNPAQLLPGVGTGETRMVLGAAFGTYRIGAIGGSVSRDIAEEKEEGVSGMAVGGRSLGMSPQMGIQKSRVRVSLLSHLVFTEFGLEPVFALDLAWQLL